MDSEAPTSSRGVAQETLLGLLADDERVRSRFAQSGQTSGVVYRGAMRALAQMRNDWAEQNYRSQQALPRFQDALARAAQAWRPPHGDQPNREAEQELSAFLVGINLRWPWLIESTTGAFTWFVDGIVASLSSAGWETAAAPIPGELPRSLPLWMFAPGDAPVALGEHAFRSLQIQSGDSVERVAERFAHWREVELEPYLAAMVEPSVAPGPAVDKRLETIRRNVRWLYRNQSLGISLRTLADEEFADRERHGDVRGGIATARRLLEERPFRQPIVTLDEYESGRIRI